MILRPSDNPSSNKICPKGFRAKGASNKTFRHRNLEAMRKQKPLCESIAGYFATLRQTSDLIVVKDSREGLLQCCESSPLTF